MLALILALTSVVKSVLPLLIKTEKANMNVAVLVDFILLVMGTHAMVTAPMSLNF